MSKKYEEMKDKITNIMIREKQNSNVLTKGNVTENLNRRLTDKRHFDFSVYMDMAYCLDFAISTGDLETIRKVVERIDQFFFMYFKNDYKKQISFALQA